MKDKSVDGHRLSLAGLITKGDIYLVSFLRFGSTSPSGVKDKC